LQRELLDGFGADSFQRRLKKLREECQGPAGARRYNVERLKLLLTVHGEVLPRYGFDGGLPGVMAMMAAFSAPVLAASAEVSGRCGSTGRPDKFAEGLKNSLQASTTQVPDCQSCSLRLH